MLEVALLGKCFSIRGVFIRGERCTGVLEWWGRGMFLHLLKRRAHLRSKTQS